METTLQIDVNGTSTPSATRISEYMIVLHSLLLNEPRESKEVPGEDEKSTFTRGDFEQALRVVAHPREQEKS